MRLIASAVLVVVGALAVKAWHDTMRAPEIMRLELALPGMARGSAPVTVALLADLHVAGPDMPPARLERIVAQVNALKPDLVLIAGDFVSDKDTATRHFPVSEAIAPLADLTPQVASVAVLGNHDHWRDPVAMRLALREAGIDVLGNAARSYGAIAIGGIDDDFTGHADLPRVLEAMEGLRGGRIILSHSPDVFPALPADTGLLLAGHTHCGQIAYPWGGSPATMSRYGQKYSCGIVRENGNVLIDSGGLGTSVLPVRLFTHPEIWLVTVRPQSD